jgi:DNA-binding transcriptional LysR family regulator
MQSFLRVVDAGSFSRAAKQLRVGQPAVSKTIARLEERLGVCLLFRSTHGLTPTEAGRIFYEQARRSIELADEAERSARGAAASLSGQLRVGATVTFTRLHIMPRLATFLAKHPEIDVDLVLEDGNIDVIGAGIDVALRIGEQPDSALIARRIGRCRRLVLGTTSYFEHSGVPRSPADLLAHQVVVYEQGEGGAEWTFRCGTAETSVVANGRVRVSAADGAREGVLAGLGLTIASEWMFAPELRAGIVTSVLQDWALPPVDLWAVFPSGRQVNAKARAFVGFIEQEMASAVEFAVTPTGAAIDPTDEVADLHVTRRTIPWRPDAMAVG